MTQVVVAIVTEEQYMGHLHALVTRACLAYHDNPAVIQLFQQFGWNGEWLCCHDSYELHPASIDV